MRERGCVCMKLSIARREGEGERGRVGEGGMGAWQRKEEA